MSNIHPRGNIRSLRKKYPDIAAQAERTEGANTNGHEILPCGWESCMRPTMQVCPTRS
ncbi:hypothetical protein JAAARDRAFT_38518 [Jaapia argillacea MUCL 33604]|uniref:Uncharacterized protein n=1 Tax=Jaapia argillacea MUCL 33604 TaxID=933084 RepID=A0A067PSS6_9AGAM|nr:hypothetical protein JAAARDRAFT_38518 [Jaapia argillacea MUCL 33604]